MFVIFFFNLQQVAAIIGADPREIIFTSGATESNNISVKGTARFYKNKKNHVITTQTVSWRSIFVAQICWETNIAVNLIPRNFEKSVTSNYTKYEHTIKKKLKQRVSKYQKGGYSQRWIFLSRLYEIASWLWYEKKCFKTQGWEFSIRFWNSLDFERSLDSLWIMLRSPMKF